MKPKKEARNFAGFYPSIFDANNFRTLSRFEIYDRIRRGDYKPETDAILQRFGEAMRTNTHKQDKSYNEAKKALKVCTFSTRYSRDAKIPVPDDFKHPGVICLDVDLDKDNTSEALTRAYQRLIKNQHGFFEAMGKSISGAVTGAFWVNVKIEVPQDIDSVICNSKLVQLLNIDPEAETLPNAIDKIHKAYFKFLEHSFLLDFGVQIDKAARDIKRARFLSHDPNIKVWQHSASIRLDTLIKFLEERQGIKELKREGYTRSTTSARDVEGIIQQCEEFRLNIADDYNSWYKVGFAFVHQFGEAGRALFHRISRISGKYTESETDAKYSSLLKQGSKRITIATFYQIARDGGADISRPNILQEAKSIDYSLKAGERVSDIAHVLAEVILDKKKVCIKAGTGSGKSYAASNMKDKAGRPLLPALLKRGNGAPTVVVLSLNAKAQKDGAQYGVPVWTGESIRNAGLAAKELRSRCLNSDVVFTSHNYAPRVLAAFERKGLQVNLIIDESHSLIDGAKSDYKPQVMFDLWEAANTKAATVTVMSGTPSDFYILNGFQRVNISTERQHIKAHFRNRCTGDVVLQAVQHISKSDTSTGRVVIKIQSKRALKHTKDILIKRYGFQDSEILILSADKHRKSSDEFRHFIEATEGKDSFKKEVKVILTTSVIGEGLDVYSDKPIDFVVIEKNRVLDVTSLVQFADRHRSNSEKNLYIYTKEPEPKHQGAGKAKQAASFERIYVASADYWQGRADYLNGDKWLNWFDHNAATFEPDDTSRRAFKLKTSIQEAATYLIEDNKAKRVHVNKLAIAAHVQDIVNKTTSPSDAIKQIETLYPYFVCIDERTPAASLTHDDGLKQLKDQSNEARKAVEAKVCEMFTQNKHAFLLAVLQRTDNAGLNSNIREYLGKKTEVHKQAANDLTKAEPDIFTEYFSICEKTAKRFFTAKQLQIDESDFSKIGFTTDKSFANMVFALRLHLLAYIFSLTKLKRVKVLTSLQLIDGVEVLSMIKAIQSKAPNGVMSSDDMAKVINQRKRIGSEEGKIFGAPMLTSAQAMRFVSAFFTLQRSNVVYHIGNMKTFDDVLLEYQICPEKYIKSLNNLLNINKVVGKQSTKYNIKTLNTENDIQPMQV